MVSRNSPPRYSTDANRGTGWALTLLRPEYLSYASTAQTVGLTGGQFLSFTIFLAFNSKDFSNKWFRKEPLEYGLMTLPGYLKFWGWTYLIVTLGLALLKKEERTKEKETIATVYKTMWNVIKLKRKLQVFGIKDYANSWQTCKPSLSFT